MFPERVLLFVWALLAGFSRSYGEDEITIHKTKATKVEGSCITIPCTYKKSLDGSDLTLLWFKDARYDNNKKGFIGTIVYSNTAERPQSSDYISRVEYITEPKETSSDRTKCDLRINDLQKTDSGKYSFRLIQRINKYMSKINMSLTITENPCKVHIEPPEQKGSVMEGNEFTVRCSTSDSCKSHPEWLVQTPGQTTELKSTINGKKITELKLRLSWTDDKRTLSCRPAGHEDSCLLRNITLSVEHAPKQTEATVSSNEVKEGDSVTLSCTSRGHPEVSFSWFKETQTQSLGIESELRLTNIKPEDSGGYYCQAENKHGKMKSNVILINVKYGPRYVTVQTDAEINGMKEGDDLKLTCLVENSNPLANQFTWFFNGVKNSEQTKHTFFIQSIKRNNNGFYFCLASNGIKSTKSNTVQVSVKYSPQNIKINKESSAKVGFSLTLQCSADADPPPYQYTWRYPQMSEMQSATNSRQTGTLQIKKVTIAHAGVYTCDVTNDIGIGSESINIDVQYPPFNLSLTMKSEVIEYEMISVKCTAQSFPKSMLTVTKPSGLTHKSTETDNMFTVSFSVTESDAGVYKCTAENSEGSNHTEMKLEVLYAPKNVIVSFKGEQKMGHKLILICNARSKPEALSYEWKKHTGEQLQTVGEKQELHLDSLKISDSGLYICIVHNKIGKTESKPIDIKVKYAPNINIVHNMTSSSHWDHAVSLTCSADSYPPTSAYRWYRLKDNTTILSEKQNFTVLPQNPGVYYCTAANEIGTSESKYITLFINDYLTIYQTIFIIILLLILICVAIFLIRRITIKRSQNNTQENLTVEGIPEPCHGRVNQLNTTSHSQNPTRTQGLSPRLVSNIHTVYSAIKLPQMKLRGNSPKVAVKQNNEFMDQTATSNVNYVTLDFKGKNDPAKRAAEGTDAVVYAVVSKNKKNSQSDQHDYENVSAAGVPKPPFTNIDWDSDTSEEDELNYSAVSGSAKSGPQGPNHKQRTSSSSSTSDEEDRIVYSDIKK